MEDEPRLNAGFDPTSSLRMKQMQTAVIRIDQLLVKDDRESLAIRVVSPEQLKVRVVNAGGGPVFDIDFEK
jgi:hypothetical protein